MHDPRQWTNQFDLTPNVGLDTGNKDQLIQHLSVMGQKQVQALQIRYSTPDNLYATDKKLAETLGFCDADRFFTDPRKMTDKQPQQDPAVVKAQLDDQAHQRKVQDKAQAAEADLQAPIQTAQINAQVQMRVVRNRQELEAQQEQQEQQEQQLKAEHEQNPAAIRERPSPACLPCPSHRSHRCRRN